MIETTPAFAGELTEDGDQWQEREERVGLLRHHGGAQEADRRERRIDRHDPEAQVRLHRRPDAVQEPHHADDHREVDDGPGGERRDEGPEVLSVRWRRPDHREQHGWADGVPGIGESEERAPEWDRLVLAVALDQTADEERQAHEHGNPGRRHVVPERYLHHQQRRRGARSDVEADHRHHRTGEHQADDHERIPPLPAGREEEEPDDRDEDQRVDQDLTVDPPKIVAPTPRAAVPVQVLEAGIKHLRHGFGRRLGNFSGPGPVGGQCRGGWARSSRADPMRAPPTGSPTGHRTGSEEPLRAFRGSFRRVLARSCSEITQLHGVRCLP